MLRTALRLVVTLGSVGMGLCSQEPEGLFEKFHARMKAERASIPQYVCTQRVERFSRNSAEHPWKPVDVLQLDVAVVGDHELYGRAGSGEFFRQPLSESAGSGVVSTGKFALLARQILDTTAAKYRYKGLGERDGSQAHEYDFDIAQSSSNYRLRSGTLELPVAYQGTFWIKADNLDLLRLELQAYDIPPKLGLAEAITTLSYARVAIGENAVLLPVSGSVTLITAQGVESMNRMRIESCRRYTTQSEVRFAAAEEPAVAPKPGALLLPSGAMIEASFEDTLPLEKIVPGLPVTMKLAKELRDGTTLLLPSGTLLTGRVTYADSQDAPFSILEIGLEFSVLEKDGQRIPIRLTMVDAGPAAGLIREQRNMDPVFSKRRGARMDILVRKVEQGQGYIHWDTRKGAIPKGFKTKWRVDDERRASISSP